MQLLDFILAIVQTFRGLLVDSWSWIMAAAHQAAAIPAPLAWIVAILGAMLFVAAARTKSPSR